MRIHDIKKNKTGREELKFTQWLEKSFLRPQFPSKDQKEVRKGAT